MSIYIVRVVAVPAYFGGQDDPLLHHYSVEAHSAAEAEAIVCALPYEKHEVAVL